MVTDGHRRADRTRTTSLWDPQYKGKTAVIDDWHTAMAMVLLRNGITDINTTDAEPTSPMISDAARPSCSRRPQPKVTITMYNDLPAGQLGLCQMWSGDVVNAQYYLPKGTSARRPALLVPARTARAWSTTT